MKTKKQKTPEQAKKMVESLLEMQKDPTGHTFPCPCCGNKMNPELEKNKLSRFAKVYICENCGTGEAAGIVIPITAWSFPSSF